MNRLTKAALLVCLLLGGAMANAQTGKVAIVNLQEAVLKSEMAKQRLQKLSDSKEYNNNKNEYEKLLKERAKLIEVWKKESAVMSQSKKVEAQKKINTISSDAEHVGKKLQAAQNEVVQQLTMEVRPKVSKIIEAIIESESIGLLLRAEAAMMANASFDITSKVTDKLNASK